MLSVVTSVASSGIFPNVNAQGMVGCIAALSTISTRRTARGIVSVDGSKVSIPTKRMELHEVSNRKRLRHTDMPQPLLLSACVIILTAIDHALPFNFATFSLRRASLLSASARFFRSMATTSGLALATNFSLPSFFITERRKPSK